MFSPRVPKMFCISRLYIMCQLLLLTVLLAGSILVYLSMCLSVVLLYRNVIVFMLQVPHSKPTRVSLYLHIAVNYRNVIMCHTGLLVLTTCQTFLFIFASVFLYADPSDRAG
jgi:hypothetical protein